MDNETKEILTEDLKVEEFSKSEGWGIAKKRILAKIQELQDTKNIDTTLDPVKMMIDVCSRNNAVDKLKEFINEIEGTSIKSESNRDLFKKNTFIIER